MLHYTLTYFTVSTLAKDVAFFKADDSCNKCLGKSLSEISYIII